MKSKTVPHFVPWVRSLYIAIGREQTSRDAPRNPAKSLPAISPQARPSPLEPASRPPKPFFSQWFDTWRTRNEGARQ
jgi:hypothetical protein